MTDIYLDELTFTEYTRVCTRFVNLLEHYKPHLNFQVDYSDELGLLEIVLKKQMVTIAIMPEYDWNKLKSIINRYEHEKIESKKVRFNLYNQIMVSHILC
jgi:hypothetical protein